VIGRYVLTPTVFETLAQTKAGVGGELQLTDGMRALLKREKMYGYVRRQTARRRRQVGFSESHNRIRSQAARPRRPAAGVFEGAQAVEP
jgi:UTP-glucose-1-phosphate uridylyltransferase